MDHMIISVIVSSFFFGEPGYSMIVPKDI